MVWAIGATCDNDGRKKFDAWTRETMKTANVNISTSSGLNHLKKDMKSFDTCLSL